MNDEELHRLISEKQSDDGSVDINDQKAMADEIMAWHTSKINEAVLATARNEALHADRIIGMFPDYLKMKLAILNHIEDIERGLYILPYQLDKENDNE